MRAVSPPPLEPTATNGYSGAASGTIAGDGAVVVGAPCRRRGDGRGRCQGGGRGERRRAPTVVGATVVVVEAICVVGHRRGDDEAMIAVPPSSIVATPRLPLTRIRRLRVGVESRPVGGASGGPHRTEATKADTPIRDMSEAPQRPVRRPPARPRSVRTPAAPTTAATSKRPTSSPARHRFAGLGDADRDGKRRTHRLDAEPRRANAASVDRPVALGQAFPVGADDEGHVGVARCRQSERPSDGDLARRRRQEIVTAGDKVDPGGGIVDDDGQVVRRDTVVAAQDDVGGPAIDGSGDDIVDDDNGVRLGAEANRRSSLGATLELVGWSVRPRQRPG